MEFGRFTELFEKNIKADNTVSFFCHCSVKYSGRAEAFIPRGDRLVIVKSDNTMLIHQPEKSQPVNYLKEGADINLESVENHVSISGELKGNYLDVEVFRVYDFIAQNLEDGQEQVLEGTEADMADMIKNQPELIGEDFKPLSREEHTKFGFIDVFGHDNSGTLVVVECKRYSASLKAVTQLRRYVEKMKDLKGVEAVKGVVASPDVTPNAREMLKKKGFEWVRVEPPKKLKRFNKNQRSLEDFQN